MIALESGLIIREPWIEFILTGKKTWEMRSQRTNKRGLVGLIRQGSGMVVGVARIVDSLPPLSSENYRAHTDKHAIPEASLDEVIANGWIYPWVLADIRPLPTPVRYDHRSGAVTFVQLDESVSRAVAQQLAITPARHASIGAVMQAESVPELASQAHATRISAPHSNEVRRSKTVERGLEIPVLFRIRCDTATAEGFPAGPGNRPPFVVLAGSTALIRRGGADRNGQLPLRRQELVEQGILVPMSDRSELMRFTRNHQFGSATAAGDIINGANISAPQHWIHTSTGQSLKDWLLR